MALRKIALLGLLALTGCAAIDRESYSAAFAKKAHRYREPSSTEKALAAEFAPGEPDLGLDRAGFKPFAYCHLHQTTHPAESALAVGAAPVEYPLVLTGSVAISFVDAMGRWLRTLLGAGPAEPAAPPPDRDPKR